MLLLEVKNFNLVQWLSRKIALVAKGDQLVVTILPYAQSVFTREALAAHVPLVSLGADQAIPSLRSRHALDAHSSLWSGNPHAALVAPVVHHHAVSVDAAGLAEQ